MTHVSTFEFQPLLTPTPSPGIVLRIGNDACRYLRVTHVFDQCVYVMWVDTPENARYARRPMRRTLAELTALASDDTSVWGRLLLPPSMLDPPEGDSARAASLEAAWSLVQPLITDFDVATNLSRNGFTSVIKQRAESTHTSFITLRRLVLRYYYFGGTRLGLLPLPPGAKPGSNTYSIARAEKASPDVQIKRRGRQSILANELGLNDFIVSDDDIADMVDSLEAALKRGPTFLTAAYETYLAGSFRERHPEAYAEYIDRRRPEPVTIRQFRYYISGHARLNNDLAKNMRTLSRSEGYVGALRASGPGEVYEIDSTGGRIHLVSPDSPHVLLGKPTIYIIIDRWSRFIVSVYLSLLPPSYEEVRYALLIAFTSREKRFGMLGVDVDDKRWPMGKVCAALCPDRGAEYLSESMEQAVVQDLRIDLTPLPPYCPDGKAIVERLIRELKRRMAASGMAGTYAERPLDPESRRQARKARAAAVHSLSDAYRLLIEIVHDHNMRPHKSLRRRRALVQAGVPPTPQAAYLWGLANISGLRTPPFTDEDYRRLLLASDTASIASGILRYRTRSYKPVNEQAIDLAARSTGRPRKVQVRLDKTEPYDIYVPYPQGDWALFRITAGGEAELFGTSFDEESALSSQGARLWARSEHEGRLRRVIGKSGKGRGRRSGHVEVSVVPREEQSTLRMRESVDMKRKLAGFQARVPKEVPIDTSDVDDWKKLEEEERLRSLEAIRKQRRKR